jgi:hypothetical protein
MKKIELLIDLETRLNDKDDYDIFHKGGDIVIINNSTNDSPLKRKSAG